MEYNSKFSAKPVRPAQRITEIICERFFAKDGISLPPKFWNDKRFARDYKLQLIRANALLKIYSAEAIIAALTSPKGKNIYSLQAKWLDPLIAAEEKRIKSLQNRKEAYNKQKEEESVQSVEPSSEEEIIVQIKAKTKSLFDKLDG